MSTPDIVLSMMKDHSILPDEVPAFSYVAVSSGAKRHNMAKVYSGFYDYGLNSSIPVERHEKDPQELKDGYLASIPMQRWGVPQDLDGTIVYLASEASGFVTGQNIHVNGGTTVH